MATFQELEGQEVLAKRKESPLSTLHQGVIARMLGWAEKQDVSTVLLLIQTCVIVYFGWYAIQTAIPAHLQQIQAGYERQESVHAKTIEKQEESHTRAIDKLAAALDKQNEVFRSLLTRTP